MSIKERILAGHYKNKLPYAKVHTVEGDAYREENQKLISAFKTDLFKEFEVENNPKKDICYNLAYEYGHSAGLAEIVTYFHDLVELIK